MEKQTEKKIDNSSGAMQDTGYKGGPAETQTEENLLGQQYRDALAEVGNISLGAAATALSQLLNRVVQITAPKVKLTTIREIRTNYPLPCLAVTVHYLGGLEGHNILIVKEDDALKIAGVMMGMEPPEKPEVLGEMELSAIGEAMNQMMGSGATAMSDLFNRTVEISPPQVDYRDLKTESVGFETADEDSFIIQIVFRMVVGDLLDSELLQLIPLQYGRKMASSLLAALSPGIVEGLPPEEEVLLAGDPPAVNKTDGDNEMGLVSGNSLETAHRLRPEDYEKINLIKDIPIEINAVLGRARLPLKRIFSLSLGEIVALENYLGEPVELYANEQLVARGEVVLVNGQFGVKITAILRSRFTSIKG